METSVNSEVLKQKLFHKLILDAALLYNDAPALTDAETGECLTFIEVHNRSIALAQILHTEYGLKKGQTVICFMQNNIHYPIIFLACALIGCPMIGACSNATKTEILSLIELTKCSTIFTTSQLLKNVTQNANEAQIPVFVLGKLYEQMGIDLEETFESLNDIHLKYDSIKKFNQDFQIDINDTLLMALTSGTTGTPKCAMLTHLNFITATNALKLAVFDQLSAQRKSLRSTIALLPFYHASGFWALCYCLLSGHQSVVMRCFEASVFFRIIQQYSVDTINIVPSIVNFLIKSGKEIIEKFNYNLSSVHTVLCGSAAINGAQINEFLKIFPEVNNFLCGYGMTEIVVLSHITPINLTFNESAKHRNSCGKLLPGLAAKIVDSDSGKEIQNFGEAGELWLKSDCIMKGYLNSKEETQLCIDSNGWYHTGDIMYYDNEGFYYVVGRLKNMIKVNGMQVSPIELENILLSHCRVLEAAVIGIPDADRGEVPKAFVVLSGSGNESVEYVNQCIADIEVFVNTKVPPFKQLCGGITTLATLPKTANGKIAKAQLSKFYAKKLPKKFTKEANLIKHNTEKISKKLTTKLGNNDNTERSTSHYKLQTLERSISNEDEKTNNVELRQFLPKIVCDQKLEENKDNIAIENTKKKKTDLSNDICIAKSDVCYEKKEESEHETML